MSVRFILGRAGTGKTHHCVRAATEALGRPGEQRLLFLAPEQGTFQIEQALARRMSGHGYWRIDVLGFSRLAQRILSEFHVAEQVSPDARRMALRLVMEQESEALRCFGPAVSTSGFLSHVERFMLRCRQESISPVQLLETARQLDDPAACTRLTALARCCAGYEVWLGTDRMDAAQRLDIALPLVERVEWLRGARIWIDGFAGFTTQELKLLLAISRGAESTEITLMLDPNAASVSAGKAPDDLSLFKRTELTHQRLRAAFRNVGLTVEPPVVLTTTHRFAQTESLARLEAALAQPLTISPRNVNPAEQHPSDEIRILKFPTLRDEIRAVAGWIRRSVIAADGKVRYGDFAVICRDLTPLAGMVREIFREHEIPCFLDQRRSLQSHGLGRFVTALADAVESDGEAAAVGRLLRSGLLPLEQRICEQIENHLVEQEIDGLAAWENGLSVSADAVDSVREIGADIARMAAVVRAETRCSAREWAAHWARLLDDLEISEGMQRWIAEARQRGEAVAAETHRLAWDTLIVTLDGLRELGDQQPIAWHDAREAIERSMRDATVGLTPPTLDQVLVSSIDRSRHPDIKRAWLLSFNAGVFPAVPGDDPLLGVDTQRALVRQGFDVFNPERDDPLGESLLAYIALTRASQQLTISYASHAANGDKLQPSPLLRDILEGVPGLAVESVTDAGCATLTEFARQILPDEPRGRALPGSSATERVAELRCAVEYDPILGPRLRRSLRGRRFRNHTATLAGALRNPNWSDEVAWCGSPSDIEDYLQCPFRFFASRTLRLRPRGPAPAAQRIGIELHDILAQVVRNAIQTGRSVREIPEEVWSQWLVKAAAELATAARTPQAQFELRSAEEFMRGVLRVHWERWRRGQFEPMAVEQRFGPSKSAGPRETDWPVLVVTSFDGRRIEVNGTIDRVDICRSVRPPLLLIYDYKTTVNNGGLRQPVLLGDSLQIFLYLAAAVAAFRREGAVAAGVLLAPLYPAISRNEGASGPIQIDELLEALKPRGRFTAETVERLDEHFDAGVSAVASIRKKNDGGYYANCDVTSSGELDARLRQAVETVQSAVASLTAGDVSVAPLLHRDRLPCNYCDYADVCRFERSDPDQGSRIRRADVVLPQLHGLADEAESDE